MKKFCVGLLSVFMLLGGVLLASCGEKKAAMTLSSLYEEIVVLDEGEVASKNITCSVSGVKDARVQVSSSQASIVTAAVEYNSSKKENLITLTAGSEEGTATVRVSSIEGSQVQDITVYVHGEVTQMEEKQISDNGKSDLFAVRGQTNILDADKLINFTSTLNTKRTDVEWRLADARQENLISIEGNRISISEEYAEENLKLIATSKYNSVSCEIDLTILDKIDTKNVGLAFAFNVNSEFANIFDEQGKQVTDVSLTSNRGANDNKKTGHIRFSFQNEEDYEILPRVRYQGSSLENEAISILPEGNDEISGGQRTKRYSIEGKDEIDVEASVEFVISYKDFNYSLSTTPFKVSSYRKVEAIKIFDEEGIEVDNKKTVYSSYGSDYRFGDGFKVALLPEGLLNSTQKYIVKVDYSNSGIREIDLANILKLSALESNGNISPIELTQNSTGDIFTSNPIDFTSLYIKADFDRDDLQAIQAIDNVKVTFVSQDNQQISNSIDLKLQRAADNFDFGDSKGVFISSESQVTVTREFTLIGQTTIEGIYVEKNNDFIEEPKIRILSTNAQENSVTFAVDFTLSKAGIGKTNSGTFAIAHRNGKKSAEYPLSIILPLSAAYLEIDNTVESGDGQVVSIVGQRENSGILYDESGNAIENSSQRLGFVMARRGSIIPFNIKTNSVQGTSSKVKVEYTFVDLDGEEKYDISNDISSLIENAQFSSSIISVTNNIIRLNRTGEVYLLIKFTGSTIDNGEEQEIVYYRAILIESIATPAALAPDIENVEVYAQDSVASSENEVAKRVTVSFAQNNVTYIDAEYFTINGTKLVASKDSEDNQIIENYLSTDGSYRIESIQIYSSYMTFVVRGMTTNKNASLESYLTLGYHYSDQDKNASVNLEKNIHISVMNADRIEKLSWDNAKDNGVYFEASLDGLSSSVALAISSTPTKARNHDLYFFLTDDEGRGASFATFNQIDNGDNDVIVTTNAKSGAHGFIYILPEDAINGGEVRFYKEVDGQEVASSFPIEKIASEWKNLKDYYFFKNKTDEQNRSESSRVYLNDIVLKIEITVADGQGFDTALRIFSNNQKIENDKFYTIMNNLSLSSITGEFTGGIQGITDDVTVTLKGGAFIGTNKGTIRNITFAGEVAGSGFVAEENEGTITNVKVDVKTTENGYAFSTLSGSGTIGGLVGTNDGTIENSAVLGLDINSDSAAAGIAGVNNGTITNSRVEFYQFGENLANAITAGEVAGLVHTNNGIITNSFVYNYSSESVLKIKEGFTGGGTKALVYVQTDEGTLSNSFASVEAELGENITLKNGYVRSGDTVTYYDENGEETSDVSGNNNFISSGEGFYGYVNDGKPHLKDVFQEEALSDIASLSAQTYQTQNGYYKTVLSDDKVFGMLYKVNSPLDESEQRDLESYNRISLAGLLGIDSKQASKLVATSSDAYTLGVNANEISFLRTGEATLTIYSKQNYSISKTIKFEIINALSPLKASYNFLNLVYEVENDTAVSFQKGRTLVMTYRFDKEFITLGNGANDYALPFDHVEKLNSTFYTMSSKFTLPITESGEIENRVVAVTPVVNGLSLTEFSHRFNFSTFDGAIALDVSNDQVSVTPSTTGKVVARLTTSDNNDTLAPSVKFGNRLLNVNGKEGKYVVIDSGLNKFEVKVSEVKTQEAETQGMIQKTFNIEISVHEDYRWKVEEQEKYSLSLLSNSGLISESFDFTLTPQTFNNIDVESFKINSIINDYEDNQYTTVYSTENTSSSVLAPGQGAIIRVNINPEYASYHHLKVSYSGSENPNAVKMYKMAAKKSDGQILKNRYVIDTESDVESFENTLIITPSQEDKKAGYILIYAWVNQSVNVASVLTFDFDFKNANDQSVRKVRHFIEVSYMQEPELIINNQHFYSFLAKGQEVTAKLYIDEDQSLESNITADDVVEGVYIYGLDTSLPSDKAGRKLIEFKIKVDLDASVKGSDNSFKVVAKVSGDGITKEVTNTVSVVDIAINADPDSISVFQAVDNNLRLGIGIPQTLQFDYEFTPESYVYDISNGEFNEIVYGEEGLDSKRKDFDKADSYCQKYNEKILYSVNCDRNGNSIPLKERLYYYNEETGGYSNIFVEGQGFVSVDGKFAINEENGKIGLMGLKETAGDSVIRMRMRTYINFAGQDPYWIDKDFTISVKEHSDKDTPLCIYDEADFMKMATNDPHDYILMDDIYLSGYRPFDTANILSLDGNGHSITIQNFDTRKTEQNASTLKLALFTNVASTTILKNLVVNLYSMTNVTDATNELRLDISEYSTFEIAGLAVDNAGVITNCQVAAFGSSSSVKRGINVKYVNGSGSVTEVYLSDRANWSSQVAGFVLRNSGSITNSRVGGDNAYLIGGKTNPSNQYNDTYDLEKIGLQNFHISAQGNIAGFVLENSGNIAASYAKNIDISNKSSGKSYYTSGFVGTNSKTIITSFVEGVMANETNSRYAFTRRGSSIRSSVGVVSGFVYENTSSSGNFIKDCYSNIMISNNRDGEDAFLASGFAYINRSKLINCYSASQITNLRNSQMNFSGVDEGGNLLNKEGSYENCYYYNPEYTDYSATGDPTETSFVAGAGQLKIANNADSFYGFAVGSDSSTDTIWRMSNDEGIKLVEPEVFTFSYRYRVEYKSDDPNVPDSYALPYATINDGISPKAIDVSYGSYYNPIIITDAEEFVSVTGKSTSTNDNKFFNSKSIWGSYRIVADLDFNELISTEEEQVKGINVPSSGKTFSGTIFGNGFTFSGINLASGQTSFAYGLFASIEKNENSDRNPLIINLNLTVNKVVAGYSSTVGALAGLVRDASIVNVDVKFENDARVEGLNFVGGAIGFAYADTKIKNLSVHDANVVASRKIKDENGQIKSSDELITLRKKLSSLRGATLANMTAPAIYNLEEAVLQLSYAGAVAGFIDSFESSNYLSNYNQDDYDYMLKMNKLKVTSILADGSTQVQAAVAGGLVGLSGPHTSIRDAKLVVSGTMNENETQIISTYLYAGGIIGQAYGSLSQLVATYQDDLLKTIQGGMGDYYANGFGNSIERGATNIFYVERADYSQKAIGGLVGYVGSGSMNLSYSNINVIGLTADYAGGMIGKIATATVPSYTAQNGDVEGFTANYVINQSYSAGDVRARKAAGGIFGQVASGSMTALYAVNSVNYFSFYDYVRKANYSNFETAFNDNNIFAIAGELETAESQSSQPTTLDGYIKLVKNVPLEIKDENGEIIDQNGASVGRIYQYYSRVTGETLVSVAPMLTKGIGFKAYDEADLTFFIEEPKYYTDIATGQSHTQNAFLINEFWKSENWVHSKSTLFPTLKYTDALGYVIYLDQFNVSQVLEAMKKNKSIEVIVRGKVGEKVEEYGDIDMTQAMSGAGFTGIEGFAGSIHGDDEYVNTQTGQPVKIILDKPLFVSTAQGFTLKNTAIQYNSFYSDPGPVYSAAFSQSDMEDATISSVTFTFKSQIQLKPNDEGNVGLIAPKLINSTITGTAIEISDIVGGGNFLNVTESESTKAEVDSQKINVGLFAGAAEQGSVTRQMRIVGNSVTHKNGTGNTISVSCLKDVNVGLMFGEVGYRYDNNDENLSTSHVQAFILSLGGSASNTKMGIYVGSNVNVVAGGLVGYLDGNVRTSYSSTRRGLNTSLTAVSSGEKSITYGGVIGQVGQGEVSKALSSGGQVSFEGSENATIFTNLDCGDVTTIHYGGLVGKANNEISVSDVCVKNSQNEVGALALSSLTYNFGSAFSASEINYGGYVGQGTGLNVNGQNNTVGSSENALSFSGNKINAGGIIGNASGIVKISAGSKVAVVDTIQIKDKAGNTKQKNTDQKTVNVGGLIGSANSVEASAGADSVDAIFNSISTFDGHILLDTAAAVNVGGMVGSISGERAILNYFSFGGTIRIEKAGNINIGGTAGYLKVNELTMTQNYNYGDVFTNLVRTNDDNYYFGGLVGNMQAGATGEVKSNYSLTTHNSSTTTQSNKTYVNALFGNVLGGNITKDSNYYNHGVALATDSQGTDAGWTVYATGDPEGKNSYGYGDSDKTLNLFNKFSFIKDGREFGYGHKLNPAKLGEAYRFADPITRPANGVTYYYVPSELTLKEVENEKTKLQVNTTTSTAVDKLDLTQNVALIGDGNTLKLTGLTDNFISEISGFSYVSSLLIDYGDTEIGSANLIVGEGESKAASVGGLVGTMTGGNIYAVGIAGDIEVAGSADMTVGGIAGTMSSGTIRDSYSVADILYRAGNNNGGHISGVVGQGGNVGKDADGNSKATIYGTFSGGSLTTYIDANIHAFAGGSGLSINNSYTYSHIDWNDHTDEKLSQAEADEGKTRTTDVWPSESTLTNVVYDKNALNASVTDEKGKFYSDVQSFGTNWEPANLFNFGYPTRSGFNYLKPSSLYEQKGGISQTLTTENTSTAKLYAYTYTRFSVAQTNSNLTSGAYGIPNASVLANINALASSVKTSQVFLMYDIDANATQWANTEKTANLAAKVSWKSITLPNVIKTFDGNGKTLDNFYSTIFENLDGTSAQNGNPAVLRKVTNLRITNGNDQTMSGPLLVANLNNTEVSNITLSGRIVCEGGVDTGTGALANSSSGESIITAATNMVAIITTKKAKVGGLVGGCSTSDGTSLIINHSSNWAPIECFGVWTGQSPMVGGLVGGAGNSLEIYNSFNANSVISGYRLDYSNLYTEASVNNFYSGGLVGYSSRSLIIKDSYNSGIVKAGNKGVVNIYESVASYSGGIVGKCESSAIIQKCYNEGSIEAIGCDPKTDTVSEIALTVVDGDIDVNYDVVAIDLYQKDGQYKNVFINPIGNGLESINKNGWDKSTQYKQSGTLIDSPKAKITQSGSSGRDVFENKSEAGFDCINLENENKIVLFSQNQNSVSDGYLENCMAGRLLSRVDISDRTNYPLKILGDPNNNSSSGNNNGIDAWTISIEYSRFFSENIYGHFLRDFKDDSTLDYSGLTNLAYSIYDDENFVIVEDYDEDIPQLCDKVNLSYDNIGIPISTMYRIPYQISVYCAGNKVGRQSFANDELLQVNFFDGVNAAGNAYIGYEAEYCDKFNTGNTGAGRPIMNIDKGLINIENETITINDNDYKLVGNKNIERSLNGKVILLEDVITTSNLARVEHVSGNGYTIEFKHNFSLQDNYEGSIKNTQLIQVKEFGYFVSSVAKYYNVSVYGSMYNGSKSSVNTLAILGANKLVSNLSIQKFKSFVSMWADDAASVGGAGKSISFVAGDIYNNIALQDVTNFGTLIAGNGMYGASYSKNNPNSYNGYGGIGGTILAKNDLINYGLVKCGDAGFNGASRPTLNGYDYGLYSAGNTDLDSYTVSIDTTPRNVTEATQQVDAISAAESEISKTINGLAGRATMYFLGAYGSGGIISRTSGTFTEWGTQRMKIVAGKSLETKTLNAAWKPTNISDSDNYFEGVVLGNNYEGIAIKNMMKDGISGLMGSTFSNKIYDRIKLRP